MGIDLRKSEFEFELYFSSKTGAQRVEFAHMRTAAINGTVFTYYHSRLRDPLRRIA